jgi:hypothetical protein
MDLQCGIIVDRLEKVQTEAARIVTGLTSYASLYSIYCETGWERLTVRREVKKLFAKHSSICHLTKSKMVFSYF